MNIKTTLSSVLFLVSVPLVGHAHVSDEMSAIQHSAHHTPDYAWMLIVVVLAAAVGFLVARR